MESKTTQKHPTPNMDLIYHQTIIPTQKITHCIVGTFTIPGATDFVIVRHDTLELWTLHVDRNVAECIHSTRLFTSIYQIAAVQTIAAAARSSSNTERGGKGILDSPSNNNNNNNNNNNSGGGSAVQRIAVTSETGCLVLLRYDLDELPVPMRLLNDSIDISKNNNGGSSSSNAATGNNNNNNNISSITSLRGKFVRVSEIQLGRSGARLTVPGARLAVDPLGRAVFVTALMRMKLLIPLRKHDDYHVNRHRNNNHNSSEGNMGRNGEYDDDDDEEDDLLASNNNNNNFSAGGVRIKRRPAVRDILSFGSPIEAHRQTTILSLCALDGANENATFATLEQELSEAKSSKKGEENTGDNNINMNTNTGGQAFLRMNPANNTNKSNTSNINNKQLVVYSFVAGLQQVQSTHTVSVPATAHRLIPVPAAPFGPGGVIVCTDSEIIWYDLFPRVHGSGILGDSGSNSSWNQQNNTSLPFGVSPTSLIKTTAPFPRRDDFREHLYDPMIISHATTCGRSDFFMLLQDDQGDVFRVKLTLKDVESSYSASRALQQQQQQQQGTTGAGGVIPPISVPSPLSVTYFDTIPPTTSMVLFRQGYIFAASESAPSHGLYKIIKDGYGSDKEYILTRMRMVDQRQGGMSRQEDEFEEDTKGNNNNNDNVSKQEMPAPSISKGPTPLLPPPSIFKKPLQPQNSRVVPLFLPHSSLRHMALLKSYPNTPAITSFIATIPQEQDGKNEKQQQQPHVQIDAVVGRGSDSVLLHARYGYAARFESSFTLPALFSHLKPLSSASTLQQRWREFQMEVSKSSNSGKHRSSIKKVTSSRFNNINNILFDDKILLSTRQGTTVLSFTKTGQMEPDTLSGFIPSEYTIAAGTLRNGVGYVQITPSCILVLPYRNDQQLISHQEQKQNQSISGTQLLAESITWTHPHGKRILAADISGNTMVVSFAQGGGIASFDMGLSGTRLQQLEIIPSFPHSPAISLLYDPNSEVIGFNASVSSSSTITLAAIATASHEVYIVNPKKLREPLETIHCTVDNNNNNDTGATGVVSPIISVLLTYLGKTGGVRRLFCFIGHNDGTVTRCELDTVTCKVMERAILTCGNAPCQMIAGDGERVCYILCGEFNWRCDVRDGVPKTVPWRFPFPQTMYAAFRRPSTSITSSSGSSGGGTEVEILSGATEELVLGVAGNTLSLFAAQQSGGSSTAETTLEYSFGHTALTVAGRRLLQHPTRPEYLLVIGTEHRGYGVAALRRQQGSSNNTNNLGDNKDNKKSIGISLDKPQRSLNHINYYVSTLQLYNRLTDHLDPPLYFQEREAVLSAAVGSFIKDFGKEPIVVTGCAEHYTHGSGCGVGASWTQGRLRAFRFVVSNSGTFRGNYNTNIPTLRLEHLHDTLITSTDNNSNDVMDSKDAPFSSSRSTPLIDYPSALHICVEVGLLFVGMGAESGLQVYAWGERRFLRKRRLPNVPSRITSIETVFITPPGVATTTTSSSKGNGTNSNNASISSLSSSYAPDLYRCPPNGSNIARERRLLIVCGTLDQSVFIATVQPGGFTTTSSTTSSSSGSGMSFLMLIARDAVPRCLTSVACLDSHTIAVADRFGSIFFLRLPQDARLGFAESLSKMTDAEIAEASRYAANEQLLEEVAAHHTGQLITSLRVCDYDPSAGSDPTLRTRILLYSTTLGAIGAYTPFIREPDAALAAHLQPLIASHARCLLLDGSGHLPAHTAGRLSASVGGASGLVHHVVEGDIAQLLLQASTGLFTTGAKTQVEAELARRERAEGAQRKVLGAPPRVWPALAELVAKQRALVTLPP